MENEKVLAQRSKVDQIIDDLTLFDDDLMSIVFDENIPATELMLKIILARDDIEVVSVTGQKELESPIVEGRNIRLDIIVRDKNRKMYNVEVQRSNSGAVEQRARYHSSMLDSRMLKAGQDFKELRESYMIFMTEKDYFGCGLPLYTVNRYVEELDQVFKDGSHIIYVNGAYKGDDALGRLIADFKCKEAEEMHYAELAKGVKHFKEEGGRARMCKAVEEYAKEYAKEYAVEYAEEVRVQTTVEIAIECGNSKEGVIALLMKKFSLDRKTAEMYYEKYAETKV